jgi:methionine-rich copper-binding protein CopC
MSRPGRRDLAGATGWLRRAAIAVLIAGGAMLGFAGPAAAHNVLVSSDPANGATLGKAPTAVSFTFDQPIENFDPALKVFGPNGHDFATSAPIVDGSTVSASFAAGPAGSYRAVYRIVSADGHPVTGQITFTLSDSAAGSATGMPTAQTNATTGPVATGGTASGLGGWLWIIAIVAAGLVAAAIVIALRKPRERRPH